MYRMHQQRSSAKNACTSLRPHGRRLRAERSTGVRKDGGPSRGGGHAAADRAPPRLRTKSTVEHGSRPAADTTHARETRRYELCISAQGVIWEIDSFDQRG